MPARKPRGLITRAETKAQKQARVVAEKRLTPKRTLPLNPPATLARRQVASEVWRRLIRLYGELEADIVTRLDLDLLADYCVLVEQVGDLDNLRKSAMDSWRAISDKLENHSSDLDTKAYMHAVDVLNAAFEQIVKLDGRSDRKRALLLQLRQSLYLTPRARAGVAPPEKKPDEPQSELDKLLNEFTGAAQQGMKK